MSMAGATVRAAALTLMALLLTASICAAGYEEGEAALMRGDFATALAELRASGDAGDPRAQRLLGDMYLRGQGVARDATAAAGWYRKAAEQGLARAQVALGSLYRKGEGVAKDYAEAAGWYRAAAEQNLAAGQLSLGAAYFYGHGVPQDYVRAHMWFSLAVTGVSFHPTDLGRALRGIELCEARMTREQITEAQRYREAWKRGAE